MSRCSHSNSLRAVSVSMTTGLTTWRRMHSNTYTDVSNPLTEWAQQAKHTKCNNVLACDYRCPARVRNAPLGVSPLIPSIPRITQTRTLQPPCRRDSSVQVKPLGCVCGSRSQRETAQAGSQAMAERHGEHVSHRLLIESPARPHQLLPQASPRAAVFTVPQRSPHRSGARTDPPSHRRQRSDGWAGG